MEHLEFESREAYLPCCYPLSFVYLLQDGASLVTNSLFIRTNEIFKLDLSYCGLTSNFALKLSTNSCMICGIYELNLSGNPIKEEVCCILLLTSYLEQ